MTKSIARNRYQRGIAAASVQVAAGAAPDEGTDRLPSFVARAESQPLTIAESIIPWRRFDDLTEQLLRLGDVEGRYRSGSELAMSLAVRFRNHGRTENDYLDEMTDPSNQASRWYRELRDGRSRTPDRRRKSARGRDAAIQELRRCWVKAGWLPAPRTLDTADVYEACRRARTKAEQRCRGRTRATRLKVLAALLDEAMDHKTVRVLAPERSIALAAGVSRKTVRSSLRDLVAAGVVVRVTASAHANVYAVAAGSEFPRPSSIADVRRSGAVRSHR